MVDKAPYDIDPHKIFWCSFNSIAKRSVAHYTIEHPNIQAPFHSCVNLLALVLHSQQPTRESDVFHQAAREAYEPFLVLQCTSKRRFEGSKVSEVKYQAEPFVCPPAIRGLRWAAALPSEYIYWALWPPRHDLQIHCQFYCTIRGCVPLTHLGPHHQEMGYS